MDLVGFQANPYPFIARASLFALSSAWEGSPNALTEAMALGTPVVSTDCPSGPRELLDGGRFGPLVPVGDHQALAAAIERHPGPAPGRGDPEVRGGGVPPGDQRPGLPGGPRAPAKAMARVTPEHETADAMAVPSALSQRERASTLPRDFTVRRADPITGSP